MFKDFKAKNNVKKNNGLLNPKFDFFEHFSDKYKLKNKLDLALKDNYLNIKIVDLNYMVFIFIGCS